MGYYFDLEPEGTNTFSEQRVPTVFWGLYALLGFALACMGAAAFKVLSDLLNTGSYFDRTLIMCFSLSIVGYLLIGVKLVWVRKFVDFSNDQLTWGFRMGGHVLFLREVARKEITAIDIEHSASTPNQAYQLHADRQYYAQGHWRLIVRTRGGKKLTLDRSSEREALEPMGASLREVWKATA